MMDLPENFVQFMREVYGIEEANPMCPQRMEHGGE